MQKSEEFREVVFSSYGNQLLQLVGLVGGLAFDRVDERIARYLVKAAERGQVVHVTHKQIALEVGSVRGVVSRELDRMREKGWIRMGRGHIDILEPDSISEMVLKDFVATGGWAN
jgi:CRP/FNR family transcriptional regulator